MFDLVHSQSAVYNSAAGDLSIVLEADMLDSVA
jgi:hypothetical protein